MRHGENVKSRSQRFLSEKNLKENFIEKFLTKKKL